MTETRNVFGGFFTVPSLTEEQRRPPEFIVESLIPCGLTVLHGPPKSRKSFMAVQILASVATGRPFLGFRTTKCDALYLDLEGSPSRISSRSERMTIPLPSNVLVANSIKEKLADKLVDRLREIHRQRPAVRLVIVDTYSRARGNVRTNGANAYDSDIKLLEPLQRMATEEKIAVLLVHHDKKGAALTTDDFEKASGTMAITGSADSVLSLSVDGKRGDGKGTMQYTPRDAPSGEIKLAFNEAVNEWQRMADLPKPDLRGNPIVAWIIRNAPERGMAPEFFPYQVVFRGAYGIDGESPGDTIRKAVLEHKQALFEECNLAVQIGCKTQGTRGLRIVNLA